MDKKGKIFLSGCIILVSFLSFALGFTIGSKNKCFKKNKAKSIQFYQVKKYVGKEMSGKEKEMVKKFVVSYEVCLKDILNEIEQNKMSEIQNEVKDMAKNNTKVKFELKDLKSYDANGKQVVGKMKKCQRQSYKNIAKKDKKLLFSGFRKMNINDLINIFHGIR